MRRLSERKEVWAMQTEAVERVTVRNMFSKAGWSKQDHRGFGGFAVLFFFFFNFIWTECWNEWGVSLAVQREEQHVLHSQVNTSWQQTYAFQSQSKPWKRKKVPKKTENQFSWYVSPDLCKLGFPEEETRNWHTAPPLFSKSCIFYRHFRDHANSGCS